MKHEYIKKVFDNLRLLKYDGIWFSGVYGDGEFKEWFMNGQLYRHFSYKNSKLDGEYESLDDNGRFVIHRLYKDGELIKDYLE